MLYKFMQFLDHIRFNRLMQKKAKVNGICTTACSDPICQKIGCLNQDGFTLRPRLNLLLLRLEHSAGESLFPEKPNRLKIKIEPVPKKPTIDAVSQNPRTATATGVLTIISEEPKTLEERLANTEKTVKSNVIDINKYRNEQG